MKKNSAPAHGPAANGAEEEDRRERFVLHGGIDDLPNCVPPDPSPEINLEEALRRLDDPERRRVRARRHSRL